MYKLPLLILVSMIASSLLISGCQDLAKSVEKVRPVIEQVETAIQQAEVLLEGYHGF